MADFNEFKKKSAVDRTVVFKDSGSCLRCLRRGHISRKCNSKMVCGVDGCILKHHPLMHGAPRLVASTAPDDKSETSTKPPVSSANSLSCNTVNTSASPPNDQITVLLSVVPITVQNGDHTYDTYGLADDGSETTLIVDEAARKIGLDGPNKPVQFSTFHGQDPPIDARDVRFQIFPRNSNT